MMYRSSKGEVEISAMPLPYARNALAKLQRSEPSRIGEITAIADHVAKLEAAEAENPRVAIGGNNPPADEPAPEPEEASAPASWEAVKIHMDDLLDESRNWADGTPLISQEQADAVGSLRQLLQDAANLADAARVAEKAPLDQQIAEIQDRYNAYIAPMKNKVPGTVSKSVTALGNLLTGWLNKLEAEKSEREKIAREEAEKAAQAAIDARRELETSTDLAASDEAAALLDEAEAKAKALRQVETEKVQAKGEFRAIGLRSKWVAVRREGEGGIALRHYSQRHPERVKAFLQQLADEDVAAGVRAIPGFDVVEERKV